jgi:hypothetical protein
MHEYYCRVEVLLEQYIRRLEAAELCYFVSNMQRRQQGALRRYRVMCRRLRAEFEATGGMLW